METELASGFLPVPGVWVWVSIMGSVVVGEVNSPTTPPGFDETIPGPKDAFCFIATRQCHASVSEMEFFYYYKLSSSSG